MGLEAISIMRSLFVASGLCLNLLMPGDKSQRTYLSAVMEPTTRGKATYYKEPAGEENGLYIGHIFTMDGVLKAEGHYADPQLRVEQGHFRFYYADGKLESEGDYANGNKTGVWSRFDEWGQALAEKVYDPSPLENIIYTMAPTMPKYPGGDQAMLLYLHDHCQDVRGATASFVVEKNGDLSDIKVLNAPPTVADQVAQALDKAPLFTAGEREDGTPVRVQMRIPLK